MVYGVVISGSETKKKEKKLEKNVSITMNFLWGNNKNSLVGTKNSYIWGNPCVCFCFALILCFMSHLGRFSPQRT